MTLGDLMKYPVWEYALDEEGEKGQDETTLRPVELPEVVPARFFGIVRAAFIAGNGMRFIGVLTPWGPDVLTGRVPGHLQALHDVWFREDGSDADAGLYLGDKEQVAAAEAQMRVREALSNLGLAFGELFPLRVHPAVPIREYPSEWVLDGFLMTDRMDNPFFTGNTG